MKAAARKFAVRKILHPSDFSPRSDVAFAHALRLAVDAGGELTVLQVRERADERKWIEFVGVRTMLGRWGVLPATATRKDVAELGVKVRKKTAKTREPLRAILRSLKKSEVDCVVISCHQGSAFTAWIRGPVAAAAVKRRPTLSLMLPHGLSGFVSTRTGEVSLRRALVVIGPRDGRGGSPAAAAALIEAVGVEPGVASCYALSRAAVTADAAPPLPKGWTWADHGPGAASADAITEAAAAVEADVIVMRTAGRRGPLAFLRGSLGERVLARSPCPVLFVPG